MRTSTFTALLGLGLLPFGLAQTTSKDPGPSPTQSVGCEPHGDHWDCEGPRTGSVASASGSASTTAASHSHSHDHDHDDHSSGTKSLKPSPTESVGCEPHGDHWHCDGPRTGTVSVTVTHSDAAGTGSLKPSPTESVGCEPHGDHWHCDGPATAAASGSTTSSSAASTTTQGGMAAAEFIPLAGAFAAAAFAL